MRSRFARPASTTLRRSSTCSASIRTGSARRGPSTSTCSFGMRTSEVRLEAALTDTTTFSTVPGEQDPPSASIGFVTGGYLEMLNRRVTLGRTLAPGDDAPGSPPAIVVSYLTWARAARGRPVHRRQTHLVERHTGDDRRRRGQRIQRQPAVGARRMGAGLRVITRCWAAPRSVLVPRRRPPWSDAWRAASRSPRPKPP